MAKRKVSESGKIENKQYDWKEYWKNTELVPSPKEDKQLPYLLDNLKKEIDLDKIESVLEVGIGYGRIAQGLIPMLPHVNRYIGVDISPETIAKADKYLNKDRFARDELYDHLGEIELHRYDFDEEDNPWFLEWEEDSDNTGLVDLVISVETLSVVPVNAENWVKKMCNLSKKYVVNLDFTRSPDTISGVPPHDYWKFYRTNPMCIAVIDPKVLPPAPNPNQDLFICRVR